jgi:hypothetical protein
MEKMRVQGRVINLTIKKKKETVNTSKYLRFQVQEPVFVLTRSADAGTITDDPAVFAQVAWKLYQSLKMDAEDVRGVAVHISELNGYFSSEG